MQGKAIKMTFSANRLARLNVAVPTRGLMPLPSTHDAPSHIRTRGAIQLTGRALGNIVTDDAIRSDARLPQMSAVFEIILARGVAEPFVELHRQSGADVAIAAVTQLLPSRMNVAAITFLVAGEARRDHPVVKTMAEAAFRRGRFRRHFVGIEVRLV